MPYKTCTQCLQISYSAAEERMWFCPCCGADLDREAPVHDPRCLLLSRRKLASPAGCGGTLIRLKRRTV